MIGLVLVTHSGLANALIKAATMISGELEATRAVELHADDPPEELLGRITAALEQVGGENTIIMTDMFGGTPSNAAMSFLQEGQVEVLTGVNLPMVIEFFLRRERMEIQELCASLVKNGRESIINANEFLK